MSDLKIVSDPSRGYLPKHGSRSDYLAVRRMEKTRQQLRVVLEDTMSVIPLNDWRLLLSMSRQLFVGNGLYSGILSDKALGVVGDAGQPEYLGEETEWAEAYANPYLKEWCERAGLSGTLSFEDIQFQKSTSMDVDGDIFRQLTRRRNGEAAIQLIRAHRVGQRTMGDKIVSGEWNGYRIENGIVIDPETGEVVAYNVLGENPNGKEDLIVPRGPMAQLIDPFLPDQYRGLPAALAVLRPLVMSDSIDTLEESFMEMVAKFFFIEKNPTGTAGPAFGGGPDEEDEGTGTGTEPGKPKLVDLWGGIVKFFESGTNSGLEAFNPGDRPSDAFDRALDRRYRLICKGLDWPYELGWKMGELTSVGVHSVEQKARRTIRDRQSKIVPSAVQEIRWAIACAIDAGIIPAPKNPKAALAWGITLPPEYSLNPTKAAESRRRDLELGLTTVGRILKEEGTPGGAKALFRERANEIADKKAIRDEVSKAKGQPIEDWEMGRPPQGMAQPATQNPNEENK